jgi:hypothetical protein
MNLARPPNDLPFNGVDPSVSEDHDRCNGLMGSARE